MDVEHHLHGALLVEVEEAAQHLDHEIHRGEIIIQQHHLEERGASHLRSRGFKRQAVTTALFVFGFVSHGFYVRFLGKKYSAAIRHRPVPMGAEPRKGVVVFR
ncbi:hypothetical protein CH75_07265 [Dyella jiangningensis]|nr:hypothetical protein CH75_07265 [Dyella jiangningensis]